MIDLLEEKVKDIQKRIKEATDVDITPIYYSAGYKEGNDEQFAYNLSKILYSMIQKVHYNIYLKMFKKLNKDRTKLAKQLNPNSSKK